LGTSVLLSENEERACLWNLVFNTA
jgi:hypothetical protein